MTRPNPDGGGGLTGATGDLTPDDADRPFVPAELREISDPEHQADVTTAHGRAAPAQRGEVGDPTGPPDEGPTELATRTSGYGADRGLSGADPAYRMESRPDPDEAERHRRHAEGEPRRTEGEGDEMTQGEEHF